MKQLQFITHQTERYDYLQSAICALEGGCRWIQLRMKDISPAIVRQTAAEVRTYCDHYHATFIVDDYVEIAIETHADGVHLGKADLPISKARKITGPDFVIGGTANTYEDLKRLASEGVDYIGLGPFRFTQTKKKLSPIIGLEGYRRLIQQYKAEGFSTPVVAIGGITAKDIPFLIETGISGIALSSAILNASDPVLETHAILKLLNS